MTNEQLWEQYHLWLYKVVNSLHRSYPDHLERDEKISVAWEGLVRARELYDANHESDACFMTYAKASMKNWLLRAIWDEMNSTYPGSKGKTWNVRTSYGYNMFHSFLDPLTDDANSRENVLHSEIALTVRTPDPTDRIHFDRSVKDMMRGLNREEKKVFRRHFLKGKPFSDIGNELGITAQAAQARLRVVCERYSGLSLVQAKRKKGNKS